MEVKTEMYRLPKCFFCFKRAVTEYPLEQKLFARWNYIFMQLAASLLHIILIIVLGYNSEV